MKLDIPGAKNGIVTPTDLRGFAPSLPVHGILLYFPKLVGKERGQKAWRREEPTGNIRNRQT